MIVRIMVETPENEYPDTNVSREIKFHYRKRSGDNPRFHADAVQKAITAAAVQACDYMEKLVDLRDEPIQVKPYMPGSGESKHGDASFL